MKSLSLYLLMIALTAHESFASASEYRILGRGIRDRSGHVIALSCLNEACTQATFAEFRTDGHVQRIGGIIPVPQLSDPKAFKKAFELTLQCYFGIRMKERTGGDYDLLYWGAFLFAGIVVASAITPATWPLIAHYGVGGVSGVTLKGTFTRFIWGEGKNREFSRIVEANPATYDQNGWNWSETPIKIHQTRRFLELREAIDARPDWYMVEKNSQLMKKLSRKLSKLPQNELLFTNAIMGYGASLDACGLEERLKAQLPRWDCNFESGGGIQVYAMTEDEARALCKEDLKLDQSASIIQEVKPSL